MLKSVITRIISRPPGANQQITRIFLRTNMMVVHAALRDFDAITVKDLNTCHRQKLMPYVHQGWRQWWFVLLSCSRQSVERCLILFDRGFLEEKSARFVWFVRGCFCWQVSRRTVSGSAWCRNRLPALPSADPRSPIEGVCRISKCQSKDKASPLSLWSAPFIDFSTSQLFVCTGRWPKRRAVFAGSARESRRELLVTAVYIPGASARWVSLLRWISVHTQNFGTNRMHQENTTLPV